MLSRVTVVARFGNLTGLLSLSIQIHLLSNFTTVGGDIPCLAGCYLTFFWLAKQATNKLAHAQVHFDSLFERKLCKAALT